MDLEPVMKAAALRVAESFHRYAASVGWERESYRVFMAVNPLWGTITVEFVSSHFQQDEGLSSYRDIMNFLRSDISDYPELQKSIGLVLRPLAGYSFFGNRHWGEGTVEVEDSILNPGVEDLRSPFKARAFQKVTSP